MESMPTEIIDCHIHPPDSSGATAEWFPEVTNLDSVEKYVAHMKASGVDRCTGASIEAGGVEGFAATAAGNKTALAFGDEVGEFYIPAIQVDLRYPDESCWEIEDYHKNEGVRWVGELCPYQYKGEDLYGTDAAMQIFALAGELEMPVNIHCNTLEYVHKICKALPKLKLVLAHPKSSRADYIPRLELVAAYPNLYLDTSGCVHRYGMFKKFVAVAGAEKLLFGSDYPICSPGSMIEAIKSEGLTDADLELIFSGNFLRLTGIE